MTLTKNMESVDFDTVKAEKAEAIRLYNRSRNSALLLRFAAFLVLTFSAASCLSSSGALDLFWQTHFHFNHPVFMFTLLNLIIAVVFFSSAPKPTSSGIYDDYVAVGSHSLQIANVSVEEPGDGSAEESKHIAPVDNADPVKTATVTVKTDTVTDDDVAVSDSVTMISEVNEKKNKKRYGRSKSDYICREEMAVASPIRSMDDLSSEEFRLKIEKFIAAKKTTLIRENTAEIIRG